MQYFDLCRVLEFTALDVVSGGRDSRGIQGLRECKQNFILLLFIVRNLSGEIEDLVTVYQVFVVYRGEERA